jgi:O-antigen/teichoic acid export membrane protein
MPAPVVSGGRGDPAQMISKIMATGRNRRAAYAALSNIAAKGIGFLITLLSLPFVVRHVNSEQFGLWMTINSLVAVLAFADFGVGNGLLNAIARANGKNDQGAMRRAVSSGAAVLVGVAFLFLFLGIFLVPITDWAKIFHLHTRPAQTEVNISLQVFCICAAINIALSTATRVQLGLQLGFVSAISQIVGLLVGAAALALAISADATLPILLLAVLGGPVVANILNSAIFFGYIRRDLQPAVMNVSWSTMRDLVGLGGLFFVLQLAAVLAFSSDNIIGTLYLGAGAIGDYAAAASLFGMIAILLGTVLQPLWPAYGEAVAHNDVRWIRVTLMRVTAGSAFVSLIVAVLMLCFFHEVSRVWLKRDLVVPGTALVGMATWAVLQAIGSSVSMLLNAAHVVRLQVVLAICFAVVSLTLKLFFVPIFGLAALPWATVCAYTPISLVPVFFILKRLLLKLADGS